MLEYILRRIIVMIPVLIVVSIISFVVIQLPPGDYLTSHIAALAEGGDIVDQDEIEALKRRYGLDQPMIVQYFKWMWRIISRGDFGQSFRWNKPVKELIGQRLLLTISVTLVTLVFQWAVALPIGIYSATHQYSLIDHLVTTIGFIGMAVPNFLLALIMIYLAVVYLDTNVAGLFSPEFVDAPWSIAKILDMLKHQDLLIGSARVYLNSRLLSDDEFSLNYSLGSFWFTYVGWELLNEGDVIEVEYQYRLQEEEIGEFYTSGEIVVSQGDVLQVAVSGFEKGESRADSVGADRPGTIRGAQAAAELRGEVFGGDGQILAAFGAEEAGESGSEFTRGYSLEGSFNRRAWTFSGKWLNLSDSLATLDSRATEFGALKGENAFSIRYEPSGRLQLEGETSQRRGEEGSERNYRFSGQYSPVSGTSAFGTLDYFDALTDSLDRKRWIGSLGIETAFLPGLLEVFRIRSSRLHVITRFSQVRFDSLGSSSSEEISLRTKSVLTRWSIVPGARLNFFPEVRWSASEKATGDTTYQPDREELAPRATLYTRNLIPGLTTYFHGEAAYRQSDYDASTKARNLGFEREGIAQVDLTPGVYLALLNPVSLRLNVARNAEDSLLNISEESGFFDLGSSWSDYPTNVMNYRYDSDAVQLTWAPHSHWLYYQSLSEVRSTASATEQYFTTRVEWKPRSSDQIFWKYSLKRIFATSGNEVEHRPGVEWYRRWSSRTYTRGQVYVSSVHEPLVRSIAISCTCGP